MPTANPAAQSQPITPVVKTRTRRPRARRFALTALGVLLGLAALAPLDTISAPTAAARARPSNCTSWQSTTRPPDYIRVLRVHSGRIDRVPLRKYVVTVMGKEWPSYLPQALVEAGAVAVKQYAWYHAMRVRTTRSGNCYDVKDSTGDQLYKPHKSRVSPDHYRALDATWNVHLIKNGKLFMTGYRTGSKGKCGRDATGWKLYARSAVRCANAGDSWRQILNRYYGPKLTIVG